MSVYYKTPNGDLYAYDRSMDHRGWPKVAIRDQDIEPWSPPKFKVGDRVRLPSDRTGIVSEVAPDKDFPYLLKLEGGFPGPGRSGPWRENELTLAPTLEEILTEVMDDFALAANRASLAASRIREAFPEAGL